MTTFWRSPRVSAVTFHVVASSDTVSVTMWASVPSAMSESPVAVETPTTGTSTGRPSVTPVRAPLRSGVLPWLKMMTPTAPAAEALSTLSAKSQVPRRTSAMLPAVKPVKSLASQPLVDGSTVAASTASTGAVTSPAPEYSRVTKPSSASFSTKLRWTGSVCSKVDGPVCSKNGNVKAWTFGV